MGLKGILLIVFGFIVQFIGSLFSISHSWVVSATLAAFVVLAVVRLVISISRAYHSQSLAEKMAIISRITRRKFFDTFFPNQLRCRHCTQRIPFSKTQVWWCNDDVVCPCHFNFGHTFCLNNLAIYRPTGIQESLVKSDAQSFLCSHASTIQKTFEQASTKYTSEVGVSHSKEQFNKVLGLLTSKQTNPC